MPRIFDNIEQHLSPALAKTLEVSYRADNNNPITGYKLSPATCKTQPSRN